MSKALTNLSQRLPSPDLPTHHSSKASFASLPCISRWVKTDTPTQKRYTVTFQNPCTSQKNTKDIKRQKQPQVASPHSISLHCMPAPASPPRRPGFPKSSCSAATPKAWAASGGTGARSSLRWRGEEGDLGNSSDCDRWGTGWIA